MFFSALVEFALVTPLVAAQAVPQGEQDAPPGRTRVLVDDGLQARAPDGRGRRVGAALSLRLQFSPREPGIQPQMSPTAHRPLPVPLSVIAPLQGAQAFAASTRRDQQLFVVPGMSIPLPL